MANIKSQLKENGNNIFPNPNFVGIDIDNLLYQSTALTIDYTCQQDCWVLCSVGNVYFLIVDGKDLTSHNVWTNTKLFPLPLKKGQHIFSQNNEANYFVYGLKY